MAAMRSMLRVSDEWEYWSNEQKTQLTWEIFVENHLKNTFISWVYLVKRVIAYRNEF